jgi:hypothetical protein
VLYLLARFRDSLAGDRVVSTCSSWRSGHFGDDMNGDPASRGMTDDRKVLREFVDVVNIKWF